MFHENQKPSDLTLADLKTPATTVPADQAFAELKAQAPTMFRGIAAAMEATFVRTGFFGDTVILNMKPERVHGLTDAKLELSFVIPAKEGGDKGVATAVVSADGDCAKKAAFDSVASATGTVDMQYLAVLYEYLGRQLKAQGRAATAQLGISVHSEDGDAEAATVLFGTVTGELFG